MNNLKEKVAIITGASGGIGQAITYCLAKNGIKLTLAARRTDKLDEIKNHLASLGLSALVVPTDLANEEDIIKLFKISHKHWGKTDILINNAGYCATSNFHTGDSQEWKKMWEINVQAACIAIQESLKYFNPELGGQIINISSASAYRVVKAGSFYPATKFALRAISESLRKELVMMGSKTRVSCISPAFVATSFGRDNGQVPNNDNKEMLDPENIADTVLHVLNTPPHVAIHDIILCSNKQYE